MTIRRKPLAVALTAAALVTLAVTGLTQAAGPDLSVRAWGVNNVGQLGNGSTLRQPTPAGVLGLHRTDVRQIAAGGDDAEGFAVALLTEGTVRSWGNNTQGQLGNGTLTGQPFPGSVAGLSGVTSVAAGLRHALAVKDGRVYAWGDNRLGQLGNGVTADDKAEKQRVPAAVQSLDEIRTVAAGCGFSVALGEDGTVWTWGENVYNQLGTADAVNRNTPQRVKDLADVTAVAVGCHHSLALLGDGTVKAWGANGQGQLGDDSTANRSTPVDVAHLRNVTGIFTGSRSSYAVQSDGTVKAWGDNAAGQLGDGSAINRTTPVRVDALRGARDIAGGVDYTVAALDTGAVVALGSNAQSQLGDGGGPVPAPSGSPAPAPSGAPAPSTKPVTALPAGSGITRLSAAISGRFTFAY
ncbi:RCC1 domain-containing protein [Streptomyces sp. NPDC012769]|uniref:RCC1 domain-containing protein n=1 Tax=Streptomyces sp. NPDC012769 TaxID=3364848 RepID=UPI00367AF6D9